MHMLFCALFFIFKCKLYIVFPLNEQNPFLFFFRAAQCYFISMWYNVFKQSSADRHLGHFQFFAIANNAPLSDFEHLSFSCVPEYLKGKFPEVKLLVIGYMNLLYGQILPNISPQGTSQLIVPPGIDEHTCFSSALQTDYIIKFQMFST